MIIDHGRTFWGKIVIAHGLHPWYERRKHLFVSAFSDFVAGRCLGAGLGHQNAGQCVAFRPAPPDDLRQIKVRLCYWWHT